jgi:hypothetical protein
MSYNENLHIKKKNMKISLALLLMFAATGCFFNTKSETKKTTGNEVLIQADSMDRKKAALIESVLNLPEVIKFSKIKLIKEKRQHVYILLKGDEFSGPVPRLAQDGYPLTILHSTDSLTSDEPYYRFSMQVKDNTAYVNLFFEITGAVASGNLTYRDGRWTPDKDFRTGVR